MIVGGVLAALSLWGASACSSAPPTRSELLLASLDRLDEAVREEVVDPGAEEQALSVLREFRREELAFLEDVRHRKERLRQLNLHHGAAREDFVREIEELRGIRSAFRDEIVETYTAIRGIVTREEYLALIEHLRREEDRWKEMER
jgi:AcrR family transcriptional regulator